VKIEYVEDCENGSEFENKFMRTENVLDKNIRERKLGINENFRSENCISFLNNNQSEISNFYENRGDKRN